MQSKTAETVSVADQTEIPSPIQAVILLPIGSLIPNPKNARKHSREQIRRLAQAFKKTGVITPAIIDRHRNILAGHGRIEAAKLAGMTEVPTLCFPDLAESQCRAFALADNKIAELAEWDRHILAIELQGLIELEGDFDVTDIGFDVGEVDVLIGELADQASPEVVPTPEPGPASSRLGDVFQLGHHRIMCGNALDVGCYDTLMCSQKAIMVFIDPPYNVKIDGHAVGKGKVRHREFAMASGEMSDAEFLNFLTNVMYQLTQHSAPGSIHYICMDWAHAFVLLQAAKQIYAALKNICVWAKDRAGMGSLYRSQHELVFVFKNGTAPHQNNVQLGKFGRDRSNVWQYPAVSGFGRTGEEGNLADQHPTVKPVAMVADAILDCSSQGDIVLDTFLGSGTTLIAAERVGRVCYGMELDPRYVDLAIRRWQRLTGEHAVHVSTGQRFDEMTPTTDENSTKK